MEEGLSTTKSSYEAGKRPKKAKRSGSGNYCCVPNCKSTQVDNKAKIKTGIGLFHFPKTPKRRKEWLQSISRFRRRGEKDKFNVNNALIFEFHFDSGDINVSMRQGKKKLKRNVVLTFEDLKKPVSESIRKPPAARKSLFEEIGEMMTKMMYL